MADEQKKALEEAEKAKAQEKQEQEQEQEKPISAEDVISGYPLDRERIRDSVFLTISRSLNRIANSLEYFVADAEMKKKIPAKPE